MELFMSHTTTETLTLHVIIIYNFLSKRKSRNKETEYSVLFQKYVSDMIQVIIYKVVQGQFDIYIKKKLLYLIHL